MLSPIKNLLIVCLIVGLCLFLGWFYLHNKSMLKPHVAFQNGFFARSSSQPDLIALRGESSDFPENTLAAFQAASELSPRIILWADVMLSQDGVPVVTRHQDLAVYGAENSYVPLLKFSEIQKIDAGFEFQNSKGEHSFRDRNLHILALKELIEAFPNHRFVLNLADDSEGFDQQLVKAIGYNDKTQRFIITSERDKILKSTRKIAPMLLYGASTPQLTQLMILANLFIESAAPLDADLLIVEKVSEKVRNSNRIHLNEKMIDEAHRRSLKVFAGDPQNLNEAHQLMQMHLDGIISSHPSSLKDL